MEQQLKSTSLKESQGKKVEDSGSSVALKSTKDDKATHIETNSKTGPLKLRIKRRQNGDKVTSLGEK